MTDQEIDREIADALGQPGGSGLPALEALRERVEAERGPRDAALERVGDALARAARRSPDDVAAHLRYAEDHACWLAAIKGPGHPETIAAWEDLGEAADVELDWDVGARAWEAIASAPGEPGTPASERALSRALRWLGARRLAGQDLAGARRLFERDLALGERLHAAAPAQLAISLENLALVLERLGQREPALALRRRQRAALVAARASADQLDVADRHIARLSDA